MKIKLFRELPSNHAYFPTAAAEKAKWKMLSPILRNRMHGDFSYPTELDEEITQLNSNEELELQSYTDQKKAVEEYSRRKHGSIMVLEVPLTDIRKYFTVQIPHFTRRKKKFELMYLVKGGDVQKFGEKWGLSISQF